MNIHKFCRKNDIAHANNAGDIKRMNNCVYLTLQSPSATGVAMSLKIPAICNTQWWLRRYRSPGLTILCCTQHTARMWAQRKQARRLWTRHIGVRQRHDHSLVCSMSEQKRRMCVIISFVFCTEKSLNIYLFLLFFIELFRMFYLYFVPGLILLQYTLF